MGPCIVNICQYISNKMQLQHSLFISGNCSTVSGVLPPIIRSAYNCIYSIWYFSHRYYYLALSSRSSTPPRYFHPSSGAHTTASAASVICHTVTATCRYRRGAQLLHDTSSHHQERIQLHLQHMVFVTPLLLSAAIMEELKRQFFQLLHDSGR